MNTRIRIVSAILTTDALAKLKEVITPTLDNVYFHHCTLVYNPSDLQLRLLSNTANNNDIIELVCHSCYTHDGIQVITCTPRTKEHHFSVFCQNVKPHITVSTNGRLPKDSNVVLTTTGQDILDKNVINLNELVIEATICFES